MRRQKQNFAGETTIVIPGRRIEDVIWIVLGSAFLAMIVWAASAAAFGGAREDNGVVAFMVLAAPFLVWALDGSVSRLKDQGAFFQADVKGLRLHRSFWPRPLPWSDIRSLSIQTDPFGGARVGTQSGQIRILLREPGRTPAYPFGTHEIRVHLRRLDLSRKDAADLLRQLKRLRAIPSAFAEEDQAP